jgi:hypothetical protein
MFKKLNMQVVGRLNTDLGDDTARGPQACPGMPPKSAQ